MSVVLINSPHRPREFKCNTCLAIKSHRLTAEIARCKCKFDLDNLFSHTSHSIPFPYLLTTTIFKKKKKKK